MDTVQKLVLQHPFLALLLILIALFLAMAAIALGGKLELQEEAERVGFPKNRQLTTETLERYERENGLMP